MTEKQRKNLEKHVQSICAMGMIQCLLVMAILMGLGVLAVFATLEGSLTIIDLVCLLAIIPIVIFVLIWLIIRRISKKVTGICLAKRKVRREEPLTSADMELPGPEGDVRSDTDNEDYGVGDETMYSGGLSEKDFL